MPLPQGELSSGSEWACIANFFLPLFLKLFLNRDYIGWGNRKLPFTKFLKSVCAFVASVAVSLGAIVWGDTPLAQMHDTGNIRNILFTVLVGAISSYTGHESLWSHLTPKTTGQQAADNLTEQQMQANQLNQPVTPQLEPKSDNQ